MAPPKKNPYPRTPDMVERGQVAKNPTYSSYNDFLAEQIAKGQIGAMDYQQQQPPTQNGGGGTRRSGGGNGVATQAIKTLFDQYNTSQGGDLMALLNNYVNQAQAAGDQAIQNLQQTLTGQQNPFTGQVQAAVVASNPLAKYMQASGVGSDQVDAMQQMLASQAAGAQQAMQNMQNTMSQTWQANQQGRQADAATQQAAFQQALANSQQNAQMQLAQQEQKRKQDLMMQILQMAISRGINLNSLGVKF